MKKTFASICLCLLLSSHAFAAFQRTICRPASTLPRLSSTRFSCTDRASPEHPPPSTCVGCARHVEGRLRCRRQYGRESSPAHGPWLERSVLSAWAGGSFGFRSGQSTTLFWSLSRPRIPGLAQEQIQDRWRRLSAAGPGRPQRSGFTDWKMNAELLSYSRTKGRLPASISDGTSVSQNKEDTDGLLRSPARFRCGPQGRRSRARGRCAVRAHVAHAFVFCAPSIVRNRIHETKCVQLQRTALSFVRPAPAPHQTAKLVFPSTMRESIGTGWSSPWRALWGACRGAWRACLPATCLSRLLALRPPAPGWASAISRWLSQSSRPRRRKNPAPGLHQSRLAIVEFCRMTRYTRENTRDWLRTEGLDNYLAAEARGKGVLVITGHLGVWELSSFYHSLMGHPMAWSFAVSTIAGWTPTSTASAAAWQLRSAQG